MNINHRGFKILFIKLLCITFLALTLTVNASARLSSQLTYNEIISLQEAANTINSKNTLMKSYGEPKYILNLSGIKVGNTTFPYDLIVYDGFSSDNNNILVVIQMISLIPTAESIDSIKTIKDENDIVDSIHGYTLAQLLKASKGETIMEGSNVYANASVSDAIKAMNKQAEDINKTIQIQKTKDLASCKNYLEAIDFISTEPNMIKKLGDFKINIIQYTHFLSSKKYLNNAKNIAYEIKEYYKPLSKYKAPTDRLILAEHKKLISNISILSTRLDYIIKAADKKDVSTINAALEIGKKKHSSLELFNIKASIQNEAIKLRNLLLSKK